jgi:hypothetical protein
VSLGDAGEAAGDKESPGEVHLGGTSGREVSKGA